MSDPLSWTVTLTEDDEGNVLLTFTDEQIEALGWEIGDELEFEELSNNSLLITNKSKKIRNGVSDDIIADGIQE